MHFQPRPTRFGALLFACLLVFVPTPAAFAQGITGTVLGPADGGPVENAKVDLWVDGRLVATTYSDGKGRYTFTGVPDGHVELVHSQFELTTVTLAAGQYIYPDEYSVTVQMHHVLRKGESFGSTPRLVATVLDAESGAPLADRTVRLRNWGEFVTDRLGRFTISRFSGGEQVLEFEVEGYRKRALDLNVVDISLRLVVRMEREK